MNPRTANTLIKTEDVVVALLAREMVEDCAVDDVREHARCVADQAADTEG